MVLVTGVLTMTAALAPRAGGATATAWSKPVTLGTVNGLTATQLATACEANGTAVVAWTNNGQVSARVHTASGWSATKTISPAADTALSAAVAVRPDGSVVAVWNAQRTADRAIESAVRAQRERGAHRRW